MDNNYFLYFRFFALYFPRKMDNKIFRFAAILIPLLGWLLAILMFTETLVGTYGQFGLECKSLLCAWIGLDTEGTPTDYDPVALGSLMLVLSGLLMLILNVATYIRVRVISLDILQEIATTYI
jgi:hypothetical protein